MNLLSWPATKVSRASLLPSSLLSFYTSPFGRMRNNKSLLIQNKRHLGSDSRDSKLGFGGRITKGSVYDLICVNMMAAVLKAALTMMMFTKGLYSDFPQFYKKQVINHVFRRVLMDTKLRLSRLSWEWLRHPQRQQYESVEPYQQLVLPTSMSAVSWRNDPSRGFALECNTLWCHRLFQLVEYIWRQ